MEDRIGIPSEGQWEMWQKGSYRGLRRYEWHFILLLGRRYMGEGNGTPLQYSCLENPMDGRAWWAAVHGVAKSQTWLRDFTFTFHFHALEKEMAPHSSVLAWRIPGMEEPGRLPFMGLHRVGHDWSKLAAAAAASISSYPRTSGQHQSILCVYDSVFLGSTY